VGIKLTQMEVRSYRSIVEPVRIDLSSGANVLVGPNNVGKSNVMRALGLAFGEGEQAFDLARDVPVAASRGQPTITLDFQVTPPRRGFEQTLLRYAREAEAAVQGRRGAKQPTYAEEGRLRLRVSYAKEGRSEYILTRGAGSQRAPAELNRRAVEKLRECVRFVFIPSGEDVSTFLRGRFSEVLANVLRENLSKELEKARAARQRYVDELRSTLFQPLTEGVLAELRELAPELVGVELLPNVPAIEETIQSAGIQLEDAAVTGLEGKGTGVRGGLLVAMLKYLAEQSKRSLVLAVEEPESFLHPAAQELIRDDMEAIAERRDVTLLVTTHSPFIIPREPETKIVSLAKNEKGTVVDATARGDEPRIDVTASLFASRALAGAIERISAAEMEPGSRAVLVVEGETDATYLRTAARLEGRPNLLEGLHLHASSGAAAAAEDAILWRARDAGPVLVLLDHDQHGIDARRLLTSDFKFARSDVITYRAGLPIDDCEAEWLVADSLFSRYFARRGRQALESQRRIEVNGKERWVYGIHSSAKEDFARFVSEHAKRGELRAFIAVLERIDRRLRQLGVER